jgi:hypothetical protein
MMRLHAQQDDPEIFKKAMGNLLKLKEYHTAAPTKKNKMLRAEYARILNSEKEIKKQVVSQKKKEKRAFERISIKMYARFLYQRKSYQGIVTNLSNKGMEVKTPNCFPLKSKFEILIRKKGLKVPARVKRLIEKDSVCRGMGIELIGRPKNYKKMIDSCR